MKSGWRASPIPAFREQASHASRSGSSKLSTLSVICASISGEGVLSIPLSLATFEWMHSSMVKYFIAFIFKIHVLKIARKDQICNTLQEKSV